MKTLLLLRHARAAGGKPGTGDFDRPLSEEGMDAAALIGAHLAAEGCAPGAVISSPALRARQTAECVIAALNSSPALAFEESLYEAPVEAVLQAARSVDSEAEVLMLVGHNPSMQMAALKFSGDAGAAALGGGYPPAGLARFTFDQSCWRDISWSGAAPGGFVSPAPRRQ